MRKKGLIAVVGTVVMMAMVAVLGVSTQNKADACSFFKKKVDVNLYVGNDNADGFNVQVVKTKVTPKKLVKALQTKGAVANTVKVRKFVDNNTTLILNLSQAFADDVSTCGTSGEFIKVGSVVNTFLDAYDAQTILIQVEGKAWESGHVVYDEPLSMMGMEQQEPEEPVNPVVDVNVYVGNENADGFNVKTVSIDELNAENLIKALQSEGAVASGVKVNSFRDIGTNLILDLSSEFANDVCSSGSSGEYIKVGSVVNTFLDAFGSSEILITVNDEPWESGHMMYDSTLTKYE